MKQFFCGLGSNLDNPRKKVSKALCVLESLKEVFDFRASHLYLTSPVSDIPQPDYINAVCAFKSLLSPYEILSIIQDIEIAFGKKRKGKNEPRPIDIDLLHVEGIFLNDPSLTLPHPGLLDRLFVLKPLSELCKTLRVPFDESKSLKVDIAHQARLLENKTDDWVQIIEQKNAHSSVF